MMLLFGGHLGLKMCGNHALMTFQPSKNFSLPEFFVRLALAHTSHAPTATRTVFIVAHSTQDEP